MNANNSKISLPAESESYWIASTPGTNYPLLDEKVKIDAAIIGGGITGITTALLLKEKGLKVAVIEADRIVKGVTGFTTAHISYDHMIYAFLIKHFGKDGARSYADANKKGLEEIASLVERYNIDCDFKRTAEHIYAESDEDIDKLKKEYEAMKSIGLEPETAYNSSAPLPFKTTGDIVCQNQAQFHPRKYLLALAKRVNGGGSYIFENTRAIDLKEGKLSTIKTKAGNLKAKYVVIASHFPFMNQGLFFAKMESWRSYVLGIRAKDDVPEELFDSIEFPSHYIRVQPTEKGPLILVGGEDHKTGQKQNTIENYERLLNFAKERFNITSVDYRWSTQDNYPFDKVPFIGKLTPASKYTYIATGFAGWGMTHSMAAALMIRDMVSGIKNPWEKIYSPQRFKPFTGTGSFIKQQIKVAEKFIMERVAKKPTAEMLDEIQPGEGKIIKIRKKNYAVYKDEKGNLHTVSPVCQHLGCIVNFNNAEKSWDCPCHGSRYDVDGNVLHGPTVKALPPMKI